jgi:hypothetical protein
VTGSARRDVTKRAIATQRGSFALLVLAVAVPLFAAGLLGVAVLSLVAAAAAIALATLRDGVRPGEGTVALGFAGVSALTGGATWWATGKASDLLFALFMLPLVTATLLAGWAGVRRAGWDHTGVGRTLLLTEGRRPAVRAFGFGALVAIPWALGNIANGPGTGDPMTTPWQPVVTVMFGVSEEAWRAFLIVALFLLFRRTATAATALMAAAAMATCWFAFAHMPGNPVGALLLATIYVVPMTYLYLRRGLEAAIGFHICADLVKFVSAYLVTAGIWFT